jgi:molybdopterin synthase catalytic subunit
MKVYVSLFAGLKELVGQPKVTLELPEGATVDQLRDRLSEEYPRVIPFLPTLVCAVDEEYVSPDHPLSDGDDIALIPPVSGGAGGANGPFRVTPEPLDPQALTAAVRQDESGAVVLFFGVARNQSDGRGVLALEYDAYPEMAEKKLREVAAEVRARWPLTGIAIAHRTGRLVIGETSLLVAVSASHRAEAFEACHYAVDRIKQVVPIWKKEIWEDGEGAWVPGHAVEVPDAVRASPRG